MAIQAKNLNELAGKMKNFPEKGSDDLTDWIDYFLWVGGFYSEIKNKIVEKTLEMKHRGYKFPGFLFNNNLSGVESRSFLGHIAARVIKSDFMVKINDDQLDSSIENLNLNDRQGINNKFNNLLRKEGEYEPFIRIEGYKGGKRKDSPGTTDRKNINFLPIKTDIEKAMEILSSKGESIGLENVLKQVAENCTREEKILKSNWKMITERNIENWFK